MPAPPTDPNPSEGATVEREHAMIVPPQGVAPLGTVGPAALEQQLRGRGVASRQRYAIEDGAELLVALAETGTGTDKFWLARQRMEQADVAGRRLTSEEVFEALQQTPGVFEATLRKAWSLMLHGKLTEDAKPAPVLTVEQRLMLGRRKGQKADDRGENVIGTMDAARSDVGRGVVRTGVPLPPPATRREAEDVPPGDQRPKVGTEGGPLQPMGSEIVGPQPTEPRDALPGDEQAEQRMEVHDAVRATEAQAGRGVHEAETEKPVSVPTSQGTVVFDSQDTKARAMPEARPADLEAGQVVGPHPAKPVEREQAGNTPKVGKPEPVRPAEQPKPGEKGKDDPKGKK